MLTEGFTDASKISRSHVGVSSPLEVSSLGNRDDSVSRLLRFFDFA